jgi:hypothetical protein
MHHLTRILCFMGCLAVFGLLGCGSDKPDREPTVKVTGTVKYKGAGVPDANVSFIPETALGKAAEKKGAFARTDSEGNFTLQTFEPGDGAIPGKYTVTVTKMEQVASSDLPDTDPNYVPPEEQTQPPPAPKHLLPEVYSLPLKSPLKVEVKEGENEPVVLELKDE